MKSTIYGLVVASALVSAPAIAQEHATNGPVWLMSCYQVNEGQYDAYMTWLRTHNVPMSEARKKAGLIVDYKVFETGRDGPNGCDLTFATLYSSAAKAFDYSASDEAKDDEISKAHWAQWDEETAKKAREARSQMRRFIRNDWAREVMLKPIAK